MTNEISNRLGAEYPKEAFGITDAIIQRLNEALENSQNPKTKGILQKNIEYIRNNFPSLIAVFGHTINSLKTEGNFKNAVSSRNVGELKTAVTDVATKAEEGSFNKTYFNSIEKILTPFEGFGSEVDIKEFWEYLDGMID